MKWFKGLSSIALSLLLPLVIPALAAGPTIVDNPFTSFVIPAAKGCGTFDVNAAPTAGKPNGGRVILFANSNTIGFGPVFVTLTNLSTGKNINLNISGPGRFSFTNNTFVLGGPSLFINFPPVAPSNLQGIAFATGRTVVQFDNAGDIVSVSFVGNTPQNVCALLE
jgi:hypothetical protein